MKKFIVFISVWALLCLNCAWARDALAPGSELSEERRVTQDGVGRASAERVVQDGSAVPDKRVAWVLKKHHLKHSKVNRNRVRTVLQDHRDRAERIGALQREFQLGRSKAAMLLNDLLSQGPIPKGPPWFKRRTVVGLGGLLAAVGTVGLLELADVIDVIPSRQPADVATTAPKAEQPEINAPAYPGDQEKYRAELLRRIDGLIEGHVKSGDSSLPYLRIVREALAKAKAPLRELESSILVGVAPSLTSDEKAIGIEDIFFNGEITTKLMERGQRDPIYQRLLDGFFIKEAGTIEEMLNYPYGFKREIELYNEAKGLIEKEIAKPKWDQKAALQNPALKEVIMRLLAMKIHKEYVGFVKMIQHIQEQGIDRAGLQRLINHEEDSAIRNAVLEGMVSMMDFAIDENGKIDEWALKVFLFDGIIKNIRYFQEVSDPIVGGYFLLALGVEWIEGDAVEGADGIIRMRLDSDGKPVRGFLDYLDDPKYYRPEGDKAGMGDTEERDSAGWRGSATRDEWLALRVIEGML